MAGTLWLDVADLFEYARNGQRPSGIQRLAYELYKALMENFSDRVCFVAYRDGAFCDVSRGALRTLFAGLSQGNPKTIGVAIEGVWPLEPWASDPMQPGDWLGVLGSPWIRDDYPAMAARLHEKQVQLVLLVYDMIPVLHPEWCAPGLPAVFARWMSAMLPLADVILTISRYTAEDVTRYADKHGIGLRAAPVPIPLGTGFTH